MKDELVYNIYKCGKCDIEHNSLPSGILDYIVKTKLSKYEMLDILWQGIKVDLHIRCQYGDSEILISWQLVKCNSDLIMDKDDQVILIGQNNGKE